MKRYIIIGSLVVLAVLFFICAMFFKEDTQLELWEQNITDVTAGSSLSGFEIEVSAQQANEPDVPKLEVLFTNNTDQDLKVSLKDVYYKNGDKWEALMPPSQSLLASIGVLCEESASQTGDSTVDNTHALSMSPWSSYYYMGKLGEYRMEFTISNEENGIMETAYIKWKQEKR